MFLPLFSCQELQELCGRADLNRIKLSEQGPRRFQNEFATFCCCIHHIWRGPFVKRLYDKRQSFATEFNCAVALGPALIALAKQVGPDSEGNGASEVSGVSWRGRQNTRNRSLCEPEAVDWRRCGTRQSRLHTKRSRKMPV